MKLFTVVCGSLLLGGAVLSAAEARRPDLDPRRPDLAPIDQAKVQKMKPFSVRESVFPTIDVHFELAGQNLADSLADPIIEAKITAVDDDGMGDRLGLRVSDVLVSLNGTNLRGLTILQVASLVANARNKKESLVWEVRRGLTPFTVRFNGKWDTPLPGLNR